MLFALPAVILGIYVATRIVGVVAEGRFLDYIDWFQDKTRLSNAAAGELFQAFGTSAPEVAITLYATYIMAGNPAIGITTIIGSALFQLTVVLAVPFFVASTSSLNRDQVLRSAGVYAGAVILLLLAAYDAVFYWWELIVFVAYYAVYAWWLLGDTTVIKSDEHVVEPRGKTGGLSLIDRPARRAARAVNTALPKPSASLTGFVLVLGVIGVLCAFTVELAKYGGSLLGVPASVMAITVLAAGSSIPELSSNMAKARSGSLDQVVGNAVGSNTFDVLIGFGGVSLIAATARGGLAMSHASAVFGASALLFTCLASVLGVLWAARWTVRTWTPYALLSVYGVSVVGYLVLV